jgi:hypothetical protein
VQCSAYGGMQWDSVRGAQVKRLLLLALWAALAGSTQAQVKQSVLPVLTPVYCPRTANGGFLGTTCSYPYTIQGTTGIVIARWSLTGIKDSQGNVWTRDQCTGYTVNCIYHTQFVLPNNQGDTLIFPPNEGFDAVLLMYANVGNTIWTFDQGSTGDYSFSNSFFPGGVCVNGGNCPYWWTPPLEVNAGELLIEWGDSNSSGPGILIPGMSFNMEYTNGSFCVADMLAPVPGAYIGSMQGNNSDGTQGGGSHWLLGIAAFQRTVVQ